ncbi:MAG: efflux RND transporter periplasmic adaptor subunit [Chlamydiota bacterium]|nr:efflux RND transporter periplasmic adaptor subunit [Chlamydiota bacterium]
MRKILQVTSAFLLFSLVTSCKEEERVKPIRPVKMEQVKEESLLGTRRFPGRTRAVNRVNLSFRVDGPLVERPVFVGDKVKKGTLLAKIDPRDYEVKLRNAEGALERVEAQSRFAENDYERVKSIYDEDPGAISKSFLDQKLEEKNQLIAEVSSKKADVDAAKDTLSYTTLYAPYDGIIVTTFVENFEFVNARQNIMRMLDLSKVEMVIDVPDTLISIVPEVKELAVTFNTMPDKTFIAKIKEIGTEASATTRTFPVTIIIDQPEDLVILSGMVGEVSLTKKSLPDVDDTEILIPPSSVFSDKDKVSSYVWVVNREKGVVKRREITIGNLTSRGLTVKSGLSKGEWIVTAGVTFLSDGQEVKAEPEASREQNKSGAI